MGIVKKGVFDTNHVLVNHAEDDVDYVRRMKRWCFDNLALNDYTVSYHCRKYAWTYERFPRSTNFVFDREEDAIWFALTCA